MMTDKRNKKMANVKYLLALPLVSIFMLSFSGSSIGLPGNMPDVLKKTVLDNIPCISPVDTDKVTQTSGFGMRMHPIKKVKQMHKGVDLAAPYGTAVKATADGVVIKIVDENYDPKGYGKYIVVQHDNVYTTMYTQLSKVIVKESQLVKKGEIIGNVGNSGLSTGAHLHYEVLKNGENVDPADYF